MYTVRYSHTAYDYAVSLDEAKSLARDELRRVRESRTAADSIVFDAIEGEGVYCYATQEDADADPTGANPFALIEEEDDR